MMPQNEFEWLSLIVFVLSTPLFIWFVWYSRRWRKPRK
jgi:hypothetical protein